MTIRLAPEVLTGDNSVSITAWHVQVIADLPVGTCPCGGFAYGERITRGRRLVWATATCRRCGAEAAKPVRDTAPAEQPATLAA